MYYIEYNKKVETYLSWYFRIYREYYKKLYMDSWLWSEDQIIKWYIDESINRKKEIINSIYNIVSADEVLWKSLEDTIFIIWKKNISLLNGLIIQKIK